MNTIRTKFGLALVALVLVFAGCKGESPTAPPPSTGGGTPGGGVTPPTGSVITLTVTNASPLVNSTTVVTANVTKDGQPVVNGTAVEFTASPLGTFTDTGTSGTLRTTTNGVATATLTSAAAGTTTITAVVTNVTKSTTVEFRASPVVQPPVDTAPSIASISPLLGRPQGGETLHIIGKNFRAPVRVLFDLGGPLPREGQVISVSATQIDVLTPAIDLGAGQQKAANITVIVDAGSSNEVSVKAPTPFTFQVEQLSPLVSTISPTSGPVNGGTSVTIFGEGFQAPVQVLFGDIVTNTWQDVQVVNVTFSQIKIVTPPASSVNPSGSGVLTGPVDLRVINVNSRKEVQVDNSFRYTPAMVITAFGPHAGSGIGGTDVTIDGNGFDSPVTVTIAGRPAQPLRVSGTQILARTLPLDSPCTPPVPSGVSVTNVEDGGTALSPINAGIFSFIAVNPSIVSIVRNPSGPITPGSPIDVTVNNPGVGPLGTATVRLVVNGLTLIPSPSVINTGTGNQVFRVAVPTTGFTFPTVACTTGGGQPGTQLGPVDVTISFNNITTGCAETLAGGLHVEPLGPNPCVQAPPVATVSNPATGCANAGDVVAAGSATGTTTITIRNTAPAGAMNLQITSISSTSPEYTVAPGTANIPPGAQQNFNVTFDPSATGTRNATISFNTNDPARPVIDVCVTGNGT